MDSDTTPDDGTTRDDPVSDTTASDQPASDQPASDTTVADTGKGERRTPSGSGSDSGETSPAPRTKSARAAAKRGGAAKDGGTPSAAHSGGARSGAGQPERAESDELADDDAADAEETAPAGRTSRGGREISVTISARTILRSLGVLIVVAALVGVAVLGWRYYTERQRLAAFDQSKAAASSFALKLVPMMNADSVGTMKEVLGPLSTGEFRDRLARESDDTQQAVRELNIKGATPVIKSVSVESFDTDRASTAVLVEVSGQSSIAPTGGKDLLLIWLDLNKVDGNWLVSKLSGAQAGIGAPQGQGAPGGGTSGDPSAPAPATAPAQPTAPALTPAPAPAG